MNRFFSAFVAAISGLMIVSCSGETVDYSEPPVTKPDPSIPSEPSVELPSALPEVASPSTAAAPLSSIQHEAVEGFNDFAWRFYLANSAQGHENVCVSPLSVGAVLGMIANGDDGAGRDEILKTLGLGQGEEGLNTLNAFYQTLLSNLPNIEEGISCDVTNTLWCDPSILIRQSFMQTITDSYYAYGIGINPGGENGWKAINEFVDKNTNGLIKNFLSSPLDVSLAFLNTLYFKAGWTEGFIEGYEWKESFLDIDGNEQQIDFMRSGDWTWYDYGVTEDGTEAVRLNYGEKEQFSMTCILPSLSINHTAVDEVLTIDNINALNESMKSQEMTVKLPKFEIEMNNPNTLSILKSMGLGAKDTFGLITDSSEFFLNKFIHATKIKVDENGTEGAAVSLGGMTSGVHAPIPEIVFDRPFIFYIRENTTGVILFIGSVKTFS